MLRLIENNFFVLRNTKFFPIVQNLLQFEHIYLYLYLCNITLLIPNCQRLWALINKYNWPIFQLTFSTFTFLIFFAAKYPLVFCTVSCRLTQSKISVSSGSVPFHGISWFCTWNQGNTTYYGIRVAEQLGHSIKVLTLNLLGLKTKSCFFPLRSHTVSIRSINFGGTIWKVFANIMKLFQGEFRHILNTSIGYL